MLSLACLGAAAFKDTRRANAWTHDLFVMSEDQQGSIAITDAVLGIVVSAVTMGVGAMILSKIFPSIVGASDDANTTIAAIKSTTWDAMALLPIALIVFAAVVIIGVVMYLKNAN